MLLPPTSLRVDLDFGGVLTVTVIIVRNGIGDLISNLDEDVCVSLNTNALRIGTSLSMGKQWARLGSLSVVGQKENSEFKPAVLHFKKN